ncbi:pyrimidodiazepine synthase-like [Cephus cinctus]|uniref:Pyrimidodiazepine synthase-like n=1 Tax=Cephus cinctus TaxID=211228 RepID=A0AAJ7C8C1_CEPCN|nr:pyrimidodiazepine synthase-like [Cephus cinctus]XP_015604371.1 pyrimidodiazepine synthase-like [Cephus cinctus]
MSSLHLTTGSEKPATIDGQARLYSMKFCPFAQRIRLLLAVKKIPYDIVNINLKKKPEWYFKIHSEGKVPAFVDVDGTVVVDSMIIANYIEEKYPKPALYHETTKSRDLELLTKYGMIISILSNCIHGNDKRPLDEVISEITSYMVEFEDELATRGTTFYGGNEPGMLDILMWPWIERAKALPLIYKTPLNFEKEKFPHIVNWKDEMKKLPFIENNACSPEKFAKLIELMRGGGEVDFDNI